MRRLGLVGAIVAASAIVFSACSTASASSNSDILAALYNMDGVGFHGIDDGLRAASPKIDSQWLGKTKNARIAVAATTWPKDLEPQARAFVEASGKLAAALENDDVAGAAAPAKEAHEAQHELSADAYAYLAGKAGLTATKHNDGAAH
ncbi:MAG: hypothetical protein IT299_12210 [Dehalococcoidia bacterium]|nr:hypothetical protein [Dehalococcoidia bacterium]